MEFNDKQTIKTVFSDEGLKSIFTDEYNVTESEVLELLTPQMHDMLVNIFENIIESSPRLVNKYQSNGDKNEKQPKINNGKTRLDKIITPTTTRKTRKKRFSNKELDERSKIRGFVSDNDEAIYSINSIEKLITKVQRRGRKEVLNNAEAKAITKLAKDFYKSINIILDKNEKRLN